MEPDRGNTHCYETMVTFLAAPNTVINTFENNQILPRASSVANCEAAPGTQYITSDTSSPATIYVHPATNDDPATNGSTYVYTARQFAVFAGQTGSDDQRAMAAADQRYTMARRISRPTLPSPIRRSPILAVFAFRAAFGPDLIVNETSTASLENDLQVAAHLKELTGPASYSAVLTQPETRGEFLETKL
jgi:hypothetical protein